MVLKLDRQPRPLLHSKTHPQNIDNHKELSSEYLRIAIGRQKLPVLIFSTIYITKMQL